MEWYFCLTIGLLSIVLIILLTSFICFYRVFYSKTRKPGKNDALDLLNDELYNQYKPLILKDIEDARQMKFELFKIKSFDGLTLYGKYYEKEKGLPIEIMFHGYRGTGERDLSTGIKRAFLCNHNALIVDQRAASASDGHVITFGINEHRDCISWANFISAHFGNNIKIILTGISMGGATVLMASSKELPENVIGILADCSYNKASDIIKKVIKDMHLPANLLYPFVKIGARIFGHFNLEETSPFEEVQRSKLPIIFFHGTNDTFVPCDMSKKLYEACASKKHIVTIEGGMHGTSYLKDPELYLKEVRNFFK